MQFPVKNLRLKPMHMRSWNELQFPLASSLCGNSIPDSKIYATIDLSNDCCFLGSGADTEEEEEGLGMGNSKHRSEF